MIGCGKQYSLLGNSQIRPFGLKPKFRKASFVIFSIGYATTDVFMSSKPFCGHCAVWHLFPPVLCAVHCIFSRRTASLTIEYKQKS